MEIQAGMGRRTKTEKNSPPSFHSCHLQLTRIPALRGWLNEHRKRKGESVSRVMSHSENGGVHLQLVPKAANTEKEESSLYSLCA